MEKKIPEYIAKAVANWSPMAVGLRVLFIVLVLVSIVGSLVVSTFADQLSSLWIRIYSFSAALSIIAMTSMDIAGKANRVRPQLDSLLLLAPDLNPKITTQSKV